MHKTSAIVATQGSGVMYRPIAHLSLLVPFVYGVNDVHADVMCKEGDVLLDGGHSEVHLGDDISAERGLFLAASFDMSSVFVLGAWESERRVVQLAASADCVQIYRTKRMVRGGLSRLDEDSSSINPIEAH
eukprot:6212167-Pleurochrysis_carterae.AAC.1